MINIKFDKFKHYIIVCPSSFNEGYFSILNKEKELYDVTFLTPSQFISDLIGSFSLKAVEPFLDKGMTVDAALDAIQMLPFTHNKEVEEILSKEDEFIYPPISIDYFKDKTILYQESLLDNLFFHLAKKRLEDEQIEIQPIKFIKNENHIMYAYQADNIIEEVEFLADNISSLLNQGVDINKIKVYPVKDNYYPIIKDVFSFYPFKDNYYISKPKSIYEMEDIIRFISMVENGEIKANLDDFNHYSDSINMDKTLYDKASRVISMEYSIPLLKHALRSILMPTKKYINAIEIGPLMNHLPKDDEYLFILGANSGEFPSIVTISGLITDEYLKSNNLPDSKELNEYRLSSTISKLESYREVFVSTCIKGIDKNYSPSNAIKIPFVKGNISLNKESIEYSKSRNRLKAIKADDTMYYYKEKTKDYDKYHFLLDSNKREFYDSTMSLTDTKPFKEKIGNHLNISFSQIEKYLECPFKYYLDRFGNMSPFEMNINVYIGLYFHYVEEKCSGVKIDNATASIKYEEFRQEFIESGKTFDMKESDKYYVDRFIDFIPTVHNILYEFMSNSLFKYQGREEKLKDNPSFDKVDGVNIHFNGSIDSVLKYKENIILVDYKTGHYPEGNDIDKDPKSIQNFLYFLGYNEKSGNNLNPFALYFLPIPKDAQELEEIKFPRYTGVTLENKDLIDSFSPINGADVITGVSINKDGSFSKNSKDKERIITKEEMKEFLNKSYEYAKKALKGIIDFNFVQTPSNDVCTYCDFKDICYKKAMKNNSIKIEEGGDEDGIQ